MSGKRIPDEIRTQVDAIVAHFNRTVVRNRSTFFSTRYRGNHVYLDRDDYGHVGMDQRDGGAHARHRHLRLPADQL